MKNEVQYRKLYSIIKIISLSLYNINPICIQKKKYNLRELK